MAMIIDPPSDEQPSVATADGIDLKKRPFRSPYYFDRITLDEAGTRYLSETGTVYEIDSWKMRIGLHTFDIPPLSVSISEVNTNIQTAYLLRSRTSSKKSPGKKLRQISMSFIFPNLNKGDIRLWGSMGDGTYQRGMWQYENEHIKDAEINLDNPLVLDSASFRGFIAQFQNSPFLPVYNTYLNDVFGIQAVGLVSLQASMVPGMPNTMKVDIVMYEFNWKAFVPNAGTFDEIFIKERYCDYFVRSIKKLHDYVGIPWTSEWLRASDLEDAISRIDSDNPGYHVMYEKYLLDNYGPHLDLKNTNLGTIELFYTDRHYQKLDWLNSLSQLEQQGELWNSDNSAVGILDILNNKIFDFLFLGYLGVGTSESIIGEANKEFLKSLTGDEAVQVQEAMNMFSSIVSMMDYYLTNGNRTDARTLAIDIDRAEGILRNTSHVKTYSDKQIRELAIRNVLKNQPTIVDKILTDPAIKTAMTNSQLVFKGEWELPMKRAGLLNDDLRKTIILENLSVSTQNAIVSLPITGKTTPALQHLGGLGTKVNLQFKVIGEAALQHINKIMDDVNGAANANKNIVVSAVMGIQNELINLFGVKYVLIDSWQVDTVPNYPHTYNLNIVMSDFDIIQQKRETPQTKSGNTQLGQWDAELVKRDCEAIASSASVFTRMKQIIPEYNAYPDLPLPQYSYEVHSTKFQMNSDGGIDVSQDPLTITKNRYYDPDYYFRKIEYQEFKKDGSGNVIPGQYQDPEKTEEGTIAKRASNRMLLGYVPANEIGSDLPLGAAPSMAGFFLTDFDTSTTDNGGRYNISMQYKNREILNRVATVAEDETNDIFENQSSSIQRYMNGSWSDYNTSGVQVDLTADDIRFVYDQNALMYQVETSPYLTTGYKNGSMSNEDLEDDQAGSIQFSGILSPESGDDIDMAGKLALFNMYSIDEREVFNQMLIDQKYRDISGRMVQAFPNYVIYVIDEGGNVYGYKLFDTFYGMQSAISMDILLDKDAPMNTAIVQFSNLASRLSTAQWFSQESVPEFIKRWYTSMAANQARFNGIIMDNNGFMELMPGMRLQVRLGYSANAENLPVVFNGTITSAELGNICTVIAAGDGAELNVVTGPNVKNNQTTFNFLGQPMVDAQLTILQCLAASGTKWEELEQKAFAGLNPGKTAESSNHFGAILWNTKAFGGDAAWSARQMEFQNRIMSRVKNSAEEILKASKSRDALGETEGSWGEVSAALIGEATSAGPFITGNVFDLTLKNLINTKRDLEIYKRNIYPVSNGGYRNYETDASLAYESPSTGFWGLISGLILQDEYMGEELATWYNTDGTKNTQGLLSGGAIAVGLASLVAGFFTGGIAWVVGGAATAGLLLSADQTTSKNKYRTRKIKLNTGGKTNWQIMCDAASTMPNYVLGVRPFEGRSTLFFGKQNWIYTSGVLPLFEAESLADYESYLNTKSSVAYEGIAGQEYAEGESLPGAIWPKYSGSGTGIWYIPGEDNWFYKWLNDEETRSNFYNELTKFDSSNRNIKIENTMNGAEELEEGHENRILGSFRDGKAGILSSIILGTPSSYINPIGTFSEFIMWMKNSPIINDYFVARASVELEMYSLKFTDKLRTFWEAGFISENQIEGDVWNVNTKTVKHHLAYRYMTDVDTMSVPVPNILKHSMGTGKFQTKVDLDDIWEYIKRIGGDTLVATAAGTIVPGIGNIIGAIIGALLGIVVGIDELGSLYYDSSISTGLFSDIVELYRCWNRAIKTEDGEYKLIRADYDWLSSKLREDDQAMSRLIEVSKTGNPWGIQPVCEIKDGEAKEISSEDTADEVASKITIGNSRKALSSGFLSVQDSVAVTEKDVSTILNSEEDIKPDTTNLGNTGKAIAAFIGMSVANPEMIINSSVVGDMASQLAWDCMQDSIYYGVTGTPADPYKWDRYEGWEKLQEDRAKRLSDISDDNQKRIEEGKATPYVNYKKDEERVLTSSEIAIRKWQIATDNPFSKEFGEPVIEIREPFSRWHTATSETNIVSNTIKASSTENVFNKVNAIAHTNNKSNQKKVHSATADTSIPASYIRETSVDTGYNYQAFNVLDEVNHKNMARYHLKKSLQNMYDGELTMLGNPHLRPYDFLYIFDIPNAMHGTCEIGRVIHSFDIQSGFTSSVVVQPIIAIDDSYMFGWSTTQWHMEEEKAIRQLASQNIMTGFTNQSIVDAELDDKIRKEVQQNTLGVLDSAIVPQVSTGGPILACDTLMRNQIGMSRKGMSAAEEKEWQEQIEQQKNAVTNTVMSNAGAGGIAGLLIGNAIVPGVGGIVGGVLGGISGGIYGLLKSSEDVSTTNNQDIADKSASRTSGNTENESNENINVSAISAAEALIKALSIGNFIIEGPSAEYELKGTELATAITLVGIPLAGAGLLPALGSIWGYTKIREWAVKFAESEPIQVILLNKDGKPLQAGLKGADGIIAGKPMTAGWLSDYINFQLPTRTTDSIYTALGIKLSDAINYRVCKTYGEKIAALDVIEKSNSIESFSVDIFPPFVIGPVPVAEVLDGDTIKLSVSELRNNSGTITYEFNNNSIRLWGIDTPEVGHGREEESQSEVGGYECKRAMTGYIYKIRNGEASGDVKLVINPLNPKDAYGRGLAIVFSPDCDHYSDLEEWVKSSNITLKEIFAASLNMRLVNEFASKGWVNNMYIGSTNQEGIEIKLWMDKIGDSI